jgi:copper chaperone CopZ
MSYAMDPWEKRVELPSVQEVFYGPREPTYLVDPYYQRRPVMVPRPAYAPAPGMDPMYRTRALVAPSSTQTHVVPVDGPVVNNLKLHPKGLVLSVPMCCDKCVEKVRKALEDLEGVRDVILDQYNQLVTIHGDVDPERALRRVRRVKKRSQFWRMATQPLQYSGSPATGYVPSKSLVSEYRAPVYRTSAYRAPGYHTSAYRAPYSQYLSPPRYTSSYSRAYSSPYIDSAYRSGYVEPRGIYNPYARFAYDDLEYRSRFDRGTPFVQMSDDF